MNRAVFLDRDGTLIHDADNLGDPEEVRLVQGAAAAIASLRGLGYKIIVVTNQGGVARGEYDESDVDAVHQRISELIRAKSGASIDRFYYCPYHPEGTVKKYAMEHSWRKPQPGMLIQAAQDLELSLPKCWMIGDQIRDVQAGRTAGVRTILLARSPESDNSERPADFFATGLIEAVRLVAQQRRPESERDHVTAGQSNIAPNKAPERKLKSAPRPKKSTVSLEAPSSTRQPPTTDGQPLLTTRPTQAQVPPAEQTLRQILHELRHQRSGGVELSYAAIMAIILQMIVAVCLLAAILMGRLDMDTFVRWMLAALLFQLAAIAMLLFKR